MRNKDTDLLHDLTAGCLEPTELARLIGVFAQLLTPADGNEQRLTAWIADALPHLHGFVKGVDLDRAAVDAALTLPFHNGRTEGSTPAPKGS